jgi:hypothetical protein
MHMGANTKVKSMCTWKTLMPITLEMTSRVLAFNSAAAVVGCCSVGDGRVVMQAMACLSVVWCGVAWGRLLLLLLLTAHVGAADAAVIGRGGGGDDEDGTAVRHSWGTEESAMCKFDAGDRDDDR